MVPAIPVDASPPTADQHHDDVHDNQTNGNDSHQDLDSSNADHLSETPASDSTKSTSISAELDNSLDSISSTDPFRAIDNQLLASTYYDPSTMAGLNSFSLAAINRLRAYKPPPFPLWDTLPVRKRAAVLILLYADRWGDLRVVITMRAASLRSFSGHAALPGGKADSVEESPYQIARREAFEEIGLPLNDARFPKPFHIEKLCHLPPVLARTHLVVTPCVAFLHADRENSTASVEGTLVPRLDAREVAAVFTAPFYNFLKSVDLPPHPGQVLPPGNWYEGAWIDWKNIPWRSHSFYVPINNQTVSKPRRDSDQANLAAQLDVEEEQEGRFRVWGMTGRVLVDAARIAYAEEPEIEHNDTYGDADIIMRADKEGVFKEASDEPSKI